MHYVLKTPVLVPGSGGKLVLQCTFTGTAWSLDTSCISCNINTLEKWLHCEFPEAVPSLCVNLEKSGNRGTESANHPRDPLSRIVNYLLAKSAGQANSQRRSGQFGGNAHRQQGR